MSTLLVTTDVVDGRYLLVLLLVLAGAFAFILEYEKAGSFRISHMSLINWTNIVNGGNDTP